MIAIPFDFSATPINEQSKIIEERYYGDLVHQAYDCFSIPRVYVQQVPNIRSESEAKPMSSRMARLKKAGLIGCLNDSGITSSNYKTIIYGSFDPDSNI